MHVSVLLREVVETLRPRSGGVYLDGTLGAGGYAEAILEASSPEGVLVGIDLDLEAVRRSQLRLERFGARFRAVHGGFHEARAILEGLGIAALDGAVLDLGLSSNQLEDLREDSAFVSQVPWT